MEIRLQNISGYVLATNELNSILTIRYGGRYSIETIESNGFIGIWDISVSPTQRIFYANFADYRTNTGVPLGVDLLSTVIALTPILSLPSGGGGGGDASAANQVTQINQLTTIIQSISSRLNRILNAPDLLTVFDYYDNTDNGSNITQITYSGTTPIGAETETHTFTYYNVAVKGSNVLSIQVS